jgi:hypothetical protein
LIVLTKETRILLLTLDFARWENARYWSYSTPTNLGLEQGLQAQSVHHTTIPVRSIHEPEGSWLMSILPRLLNQSFDQVWFEVVHSDLPDELLANMSRLAPIRVGFVPESIEIHSGEYISNPVGTEKRKANTRRNLQCATHVLTVDEKDADHIQIDGKQKGLWWPLAIPEDELAQAIATSWQYPQAVFFGAVYGDRLQWLQDPNLKTRLTRPDHSPEDSTPYPQLFDKLNRIANQSLKSESAIRDTQLSQYLRGIRQVRKKCFSAWLNGLRDYCAVVNLPQFGRLYGGRVSEAMAAGVPMIACEIPDRPKTRALFSEDKDILLYPQDDPKRLAAHIQDLLDYRDLGQRLATNALTKLRTFHTIEKRVKQVLDWIDKDTQPDYGLHS